MQMNRNVIVKTPATFTRHKKQSTTSQKGDTQLLCDDTSTKTDLIEYNQIIDMSESPTIYYFK